MTERGEPKAPDTALLPHEFITLGFDKCNAEVAWRGGLVRCGWPESAHQPAPPPSPEHIGEVNKMVTPSTPSEPSEAAMKWASNVEDDIFHAAKVDSPGAWPEGRIVSLLASAVEPLLRRVAELERERDDLAEFRTSWQASSMKAQQELYVVKVARDDARKLVETLEAVIRDTKLEGYRERKDAALAAVAKAKVGGRG